MNSDARESSHDQRSRNSTITACLITQDEERTIANCLASWRPFVDAICIADRASCDRTTSIAEEYGARIVSCAHDEPGDSLRRHCEECVQTEWILWAESCESLTESSADRIRSILREQRGDAKSVELSVEVVDQSKPTQMRTIQISRRSPECRLSTDRSTPNAAKRSAEFDVIVLSYAKTAREYEMTRQCLASLWASAKRVRFNVVVVETSSPDELRRLSGDERFFGDESRVVFPQREFNYNQFLQVGFDELNESSAKYLLIVNNDVVFENEFAEHLLLALEQYDSVSPWCPGYHDQCFDASREFHPGFRTSLELCGWALAFRKKMLDQISFEELFPSDFAFWFQDNYYAWQLQRLGVRHSLVTRARVRHLFEQSHTLIDPAKRHRLTRGAQDVFAAKISGSDEPEELPLTVAIPSLPSRATSSFPDLVEKLSRQSEGKPVEIISLMDNKWSTLGAKRNALMSLAQGKYIVFVDDDDDVSDDYIDSLLAAIATSKNADCISFNAWVTLDGASGRICKYGIDYDDINTSEAYFRRPNHVCCFRTDLARRVPRKDITWGEDSAWAEQILPHIQHEVRIDRILYYYRYNSEGSEAPQDPQKAGALACHPPQLTIAVLAVAQRARRFLPTLVNELAQQASGKPVELLVLMDNQRRTTGAKRNALVSEAQGDYLVFVDDDDGVAHEYVASILDAIGQNPHADCIVFDAMVTVNGRSGKLCRYGIEYENEDKADGYYRRPNHICCIRSDIAKSVPFEKVSWHEDFRWADAIADRLSSQTRIKKTLYHYRYDDRESVAVRERLSRSIARTPQNVTGQVHLDSDPSEVVGSTDASQREVCDKLLSIATTRPIYGFMHVAMLNHWRRIVEEQLVKLHASGLWDRTERIFVGLLGPRREDFDFADAKLEVVYHSAALSEAEFPTLGLLQRFCHEHDSLVYYLHTKGVAKVSSHTRDWRHLMEYFVIQRHEDCIRALADHDICGVNWNLATLGPHYSGNFWWARSSYIRTLPPLQSLCDSPVDAHPTRHSCERWIGLNPAARAATLHQSDTNHYESPYPRSKYARLQTVENHSSLDVTSAWRGLDNQFQDLLEVVDPIRTVVEIGVEYGYSMFSFAGALPQATVIGIDPYQGLYQGRNGPQLRGIAAPGDVGSEAAEVYVRRFLPDFPRTMLLRATSEEAASRFAGQIDVLHIDAIPTYDEVAAHFALWVPKLRPGGCVLFHDTRSFPQDVGRFFQQLPGRKAEITNCHGLGAWYKPKNSTNCISPAVPTRAGFAVGEHDTTVEQRSEKTPVET